MSMQAFLVAIVTGTGLTAAVVALVAQLTDPERHRARAPERRDGPFRAER